MNLFKVLIGILVVLFFSGAVFAKESLISEGPSQRLSHRAGVSIGLDDPVPAVVGFSLNYNVFDGMRATVGLGRFNSDYNYNGYVLHTESVTYGGGFRVLVPGWNLTPVVGISWSTIATVGFADDHHFYSVAGLEWQLRNGLNLSAGYEQSFKKKIGGLPYVTAGWYFDVL